MPPLMAATLLIVLVGLIALFIAERRMRRKLERESFRHANDYFADRYFDHQVLHNRYIRLQGHRLIYKGRLHRKTISVYQIDTVEYRWFRFYVRLQNGRQVILPTGFRNQPYIYAILKYHRPVGRNQPERNLVSTRKVVVASR